MIIKITSIGAVGTFLIIFTIKSEALKTRMRHFITGDKARQHPVRSNHYIWPNEEKFIKVLGNFFNHTTQYSTSAKNLNQAHRDAVIYSTEEIMKEQTNIEMNIERSVASSLLIHRNRSLLKTLNPLKNDTNASERLEFQKNNHQPLYIQNEQNSKSQKLLHFRMLTELLRKSPHAHIPDAHVTLHQRDNPGKPIDSDASSTKLALAVLNENTNTDKKQETRNKYNVRIGIKFYVNGENCKYSIVEDKNKNKDNSQCTDYIIIPEMNQNENLKRVINNSVFKLMPIETNFNDHKISEKENLFGEEPYKLFPDNLDPLFLERIQNIALKSNTQVEDLTSFPINSHYQTSQKVTSKGDNQNNLALYEYPSIYLQPPLYSSSLGGQISSLQSQTYGLPEAYYPSAHRDDINNRGNNKVHILPMHNLTEIPKPEYITTYVSEQGNIKFPSFNTQLSDTRPNPLNREITQYITPSSFKRGYSRKQVFNHRYQTNRHVTENFPSESVSNTHKLSASTKNRNINFVLQFPQIIHTKFNNFPRTRTFSSIWPRSHPTMQSRFFDNSELNSYPTLPTIPHSIQRHSQTTFSLSSSLTPPSAFNIPLDYSQNIQA